MKISITTAVRTPFKEVFQSFDEKLFLALKPPLLPMNLLRFDGCQVGHEVHIDLGYKVWISLITEHVENEELCYFVDEGSQLPFPLRSWRHQHLIKQHKDHTLIVDNINFSSGFELLDYGLYPFLYFMFLLRQPVYRKFFGAL